VIGAPTLNSTMVDVLARGMAAAVILGVLNWLYDALAIRAGFLKVYNQPWADGRDAWSIASDYAPWFFGGFGLIYAAGLKLAEGALLTEPHAGRAIAVGLTILTATLTLPTLGYVVQSYARHGHHGCRPIMRAEPS